MNLLLCKEWFHSSDQQEDFEFVQDENSPLLQEVQREFSFKSFENALNCSEEHYIAYFYEKRLLLHRRDGRLKEKIKQLTYFLDKERKGDNFSEVWRSLLINAIAKYGNDELLRSVIAHGHRINLNSCHSVQNVIFSAVQYGMDTYGRCLDLLLDQRDVPINVIKEDGFMPIHLVIPSENLLKLYLDKASQRLLLDIVINGKTIREEIIENHPHLDEYMSRIQKIGMCDVINDLSSLLLKYDAKEFVKQFENLQEEVDCRLFLYLCSKQVLPRALDCVLKKMKESNCFGYTYFDYYTALKVFIQSDSKIHLERKMKFLYAIDKHLNWKIILHELNELLYDAILIAQGDGFHEIAQFFITQAGNLLAFNRNNLRPIDICSSEVFESYLDSQISVEGGLYTVNFSKLCSPPAISAIGTSPIYPGTQILEVVRENRNLCHLLTHPTLSTFTFMKWHRVKKLYYVNLTFYLFFSVFLTICILYPVSINNYFRSDTIIDQSDDSINFLFTLQIITYTLTFVFMLREFLQMILIKLKYFSNWENWVELLIVSLTVSTLIFQYLRNYELYHRLGTSLIPLVYFELFHLLGKHPKFSLKVEMFKTVAISFIKFFDFFIFYILSSTFCFYLMFHSDKKPFNNIFSALFKTVMMMTGEFDAGVDGEIPFEIFPGFSNLVFLLFVFFGAVVLMNLLVGLAVSDVQKIAEEATFHACLARVNFIHLTERGMFEMKRLNWDKTPFLKTIFETVFHTIAHKDKQYGFAIFSDSKLKNCDDCFGDFDIDKTTLNNIKMKAKVAGRERNSRYARNDETDHANTKG